MYRWNIFTFFPSNNRFFFIRFFFCYKMFSLTPTSSKKKSKGGSNPPPPKSQGNCLNLQSLGNQILIKNEEYKDTSKHDDRLNLLSDWKIREVRHRERAKHDFQQKWTSDTSGYLRKGDNRRQYIFKSESAKEKRDLWIVTPKVCLTAAISNAT